ncbi:MAG: hypothetical protein N3E47_00865 [Candidatus Bathyarchaeota archaeon]|nr:hypothetical protein [Candidatus Bathyarchaeota archaeon]
MKFKELGWNGFLLQIPEEMRLTAESGNINSGYFKLEMENLLLEVKWEQINPKKPKSLAEISTSFIGSVKKSIEKTAKKKIDVKVKTAENIFISSHNARSMVLETGSGLREPTYIWICEKSNRIITAHFVFPPLMEEGEKLIEHLLGSFKCHTEEDLVTWSALNIRFSVPRSFLLTERRIAVGRTYLTFMDQRFSTFTEVGRRLSIEYFSMANVLFEDTYKDIDAWFQKNYWKDLKKSHKNIAFQSSEAGKIMRHNAVYRYGIRKSGLSTRKTTLCKNLTWYCSKSNRIYSITYTSYVSRPFFLKRKLNEEEEEKIFQNFLSSFKCHF